MNAEMLARALGAVRSGRQWKCRCVAHDDAGPSMIIFDGRERVQVRCLAGCETLDVIAALRARGLWEREAQDDTYAKRINMRPPAEPDREQQRMRDRERRIWEETTECESTMAEDYFEGRDIWTVAKELPSIVRFHPRCPRGHELAPAVVVAMRHVQTNALLAVQRIFIVRKGSYVVKDGTPMMLGTAGGCAMKLGAAKGYVQPGVDLHICEGLESGLSIMALSWSPVWAMGSTSLIRSLPVLPGVERLMIWTDHDAVDPKTGKRPGEAAATACGERWMAAGREVMLQIAKAEGDDPNDEWRRRCGRL